MCGLVVLGHTLPCAVGTASGNATGTTAGTAAADTTPDTGCCQTFGQSLVGQLLDDDIVKDTQNSTHSLVLAQLNFALLCIHVRVLITFLT